MAYLYNFELAKQKKCLEKEARRENSIYILSLFSISLQRIQIPRPDISWIQREELRMNEAWMITGSGYDPKKPAGVTKERKSNLRDVEGCYKPHHHFIYYY